MYAFDAGRALAAIHRSRFVRQPPVLLQLRPGVGTQRFVDRYRPTSRWKLLAFQALASVLPSSTEAAARLNMRNMFVVDAESVQAMLDAAHEKSSGGSGSVANESVPVAPPSPSPLLSGVERRPGHCLDIGAGVGTTTVELQRLFSEVSATEVSSGCLRRLRQLDNPPLSRVMHAEEFPVSKPSAEPDEGIHVDSNGDGNLGSPSFDLVSLLNVLDRCGPHPLSLLKTALSSVRSSQGKVLVALAYPFDPFEAGKAGSSSSSESGGGSDEVLEMRRHLCPAVDFEDFLGRAVGLFARHGLRCDVAARVPYLCQADAPWAAVAKEIADAESSTDSPSDDDIGEQSATAFVRQVPPSIEDPVEEARVWNEVSTQFYVLDDAVFLLSCASE